MDKKEALKELISLSRLLDEPGKKTLISRLPELTSEELEEYGMLFAVEAKVNFSSSPLIPKSFV